jgi:hypothetical protein
LNVCSVCRHPQLGDVDRALLAGQLTLREISAKFTLSRSSLSRHQGEHLAGKLAAAKGASEAAGSARLLERMEYIVAATEEILEEARTAGDGKDNRTALRAIARLEKQVELTARIVGILQQAPMTVNLVVVKEWIDLRGAILQAVLPFPEAAKAIAEAIARLEP